MITKRIPVSEDLWRELGNIKQAGQTYDELLKELIQFYNRQDLAERQRLQELGKAVGERLTMYEITLSEEVMTFLGTLDKKSKKICKTNLMKLKYPYPERGPGDKERLVVAGEEIYHLHIGRTYTAFYAIDEGAQDARAIEVLTIKAAHKKYGW